jgi:diaminopropionate ammonia-lyase
VGSLAQAAVAHYRSQPDPGWTSILSAEPVTAACVLASLQAGRAVTVPTQVTIMAGLNCGTPSGLAWPYLRQGLDGAAAVSDAEAVAAGNELRTAGVDAGPCGWSALASLRVALATPEARTHLRAGQESTVVLIATEGAAANPAGD